MLRAVILYDNTLTGESYKHKQGKDDTCTPCPPLPDVHHHNLPVDGLEVYDVSAHSISPACTACDDNIRACPPLPDVHHHRLPVNGLEAHDVSTHSLSPACTANDDNIRACPPLPDVHHHRLPVDGLEAHDVSAHSLIRSKHYIGLGQAARGWSPISRHALPYPLQGVKVSCRQQSFKLRACMGACVHERSDTRASYKEYAERRRRTAISSWIRRAGAAHAPSSSGHITGIRKTGPLMHLSTMLHGQEA
eukprot:1144044-Pelagomonas_calceolata.AAC.6